MRRLILSFVVALLALGVAAIAGEKKNVEKGKMEHKLIGEVVTVNPGAMVLTAREAEKGGKTVEITFNVEPSAKVLIHGKSGRLDDLKAGDGVTVKYFKQDGKNMAKEIEHA